MAGRVIERGRLVLGKRVDKVERGKGNLGMVVKSLENKWGVNVHITPIARFRKLALVRGRKHLFKLGI